MWRSPVAMFVSLVHYRGLLRTSNPLEIEFLLIRSQQHWFVCHLDNGSIRSAWAPPESLTILLHVDRPTIGNIVTHFSAMGAEITSSTFPRLRSLSVSPISGSTRVSTSSLGLFSRSARSLDRLGRVVGFYWLIDSESHRFSLNVLSEDLVDCLVQVQLWVAIGKSRAEYSQLAGKLERRARALTSSSKLIPWEESLDNTCLKVLMWEVSESMSSHLHIEQLPYQYELRRGGFLLVYGL